MKSVLLPKVHFFSTQVQLPTYVLSVCDTSVLAISFRYSRTCEHFSDFLYVYGNIKGLHICVKRIEIVPELEWVFGMALGGAPVKFRKLPHPFFGVGDPPPPPTRHTVRHTNETRIRTPPLSNV